MRIIQLTAENVKRLKAVDITPHGDVVVLSGKNGSGKTSVLDAMWWALGGEKNIQDQPIRAGSNSARVRIDLGDIIVERRFNASGSTSLAVWDAARAPAGTPDKKLPKYGSPQEVLNGLIGRLSFDPLEFCNMREREQFDELRKVAQINLDFEALDAQNRSDFDHRRDLNREAKALRARAEGISVEAGLPAEEIDEGTLLNEWQAAGERNGEIARMQDNRNARARSAEDQRAAASRLETERAAHLSRSQQRAEELRKQLADFERDAAAVAEALKSKAEEAREDAERIEANLSSLNPIPERIDVAEIRARVDAAKITNAAIRRRKERDAIQAQATEIERQAAVLTDRMEKREASKAEALKSAKMPIPDIGFGPGYITYQGVPFSQASDAEKIRVSTAIAMAANPKLRVIRIKNGSLLDDDNMQVIRELAGAQDYQVWVECVDGSGKLGIVLEDGQVAAVNEG